MFDKLRQSIGVLPGQSQIQHPNKPPVTLVSHILHLAAAPPDGSLHPVWNTNSKFDQLTWATLPDEFKQVPFSSLSKLRSLYAPAATDQLQHRDYPTYSSFQGNLPFRSYLPMTFQITLPLLTLFKVKFADATNPWFDVMPNHTIMLSGFPPKGLCIVNLPWRSLNLLF